MTSDYVPQDFFGEDTVVAEPAADSTPASPSTSTSKGKSRISMTKIIMISMLVTVIIVVIYMFIKRARGGIPDALEGNPEAPMSTEHDNIVANTSKAELAALLNSDFKKVDVRTPSTNPPNEETPPTESNPLRDRYLSQFATLERVTMAFIGTLPPHLANSIIAAKKTFENVKLDEGSTPTETDNFMTYYGLDVANKIMERPEQQPSKEEPILKEVPKPIIKKEGVVNDNVQQNNVSFIEEISSNDDQLDSKKIAAQLDNGSDDEDEQ
jgi:hypothetical protein